MTGIVGKNPLLLRELNLSEHKLGDTRVNQISALLLSDCSITEEGYKALASALRSNPSHLIELDLTGNDPGQSGVKQLSDLMQVKNCKLKLRLNNNSITEEGCSALTSAFNSNPSNLIELDLSGNKLQNSGIEKICHLLENKQCRLEKLKLSDCSITEEGYKALASALRSKPSHLIELDIIELSLIKYVFNSINHIILFDYYKTFFPNRLSDCSITEEGYKALASALRSNPSHLIEELDLSMNELGDSGVKHLSDLLMNPQCKLEILALVSLYCTAYLNFKLWKLKTIWRTICLKCTDDCSALTSALRSNPSHLRELDLSGNEIGQSRVENLCDLLMNPQCKLEKLELVILYSLNFLSFPLLKKDSKVL
uniref:Uncharacterized protein n=1 Tax=Sinocyclocheilus rhinocerous TaxID=307959 RepID=A0A673IJL0_9TELE